AGRAEPTSARRSFGCGPRSAVPWPEAPTKSGVLPTTFRARPFLSDPWMACSHDSATLRPVQSGLTQLCLDASRRDLGSARQVDDLALVFEEVEFPFPIIAHDEGVDVVLVDVGRLLLPVVFGNDEIDVADRLEHVLAFFEGEVRLLAF